MTIKPKFFAMFFFLVWFGVAGTCFAGNVLNQLVLQKAELQSRFGIHWLECFPFAENVGFMEDQASLARNCLASVRTLKEALAEVPDAGIKTVGIGSRLFWTSGFYTLLIPWNATKSEIAGFIRQRPPTKEGYRASAL